MIQKKNHDMRAEHMRSLSNDGNDLLNAGIGTVGLNNDACYGLSFYETDENALFLGPKMGFSP